jgi:predicted methyltransferase
MITRRTVLVVASLWALASASPVWAQSQDRPPGQPIEDDDPALATAVGSPQRSAANTARDRWRHPLQSLAFWGLAPGLTVIDVDPGGGYWTEILAPYLAQGGGRYLAGLPDDARDTFAARYAGRPQFGQIGFTTFTNAAGLSAPPSSADLILTSRNIHNMMWAGGLDLAMSSFFEALRPGGVLAVEEHRADPRAMIADARDGYVSEAVVIAAAAKAGFKLDGRSEVNANPKDSKDHPFGVWTLPPTRRSAPEGQPPNAAFDHAKYDAIGESDRMTLRFTKPE